MLHEERDFATNRHEQCGLVGDNTALVGCQCVQARKIHERFCCHRGFATLGREASFVKQFRNLLTC